MIRWQTKVLLYWLQVSLQPDCKNLGSGVPSLKAAGKPCPLLQPSLVKGLSLMRPKGKISMLCMVFCFKTLECWKEWNFKINCIKTLQIKKSMKPIMISSPKSREAAPGHRRLKEKGTLGISIFGPKLARFWPNNEDV